MDPFRLCVAVGPLAMYCLVLGIINLSRRPLCTSGGRDLAALGLALAGMFVVGPIELFVPDAAAARFHNYTWLLLIGFYALCVAVVVLLVRPRLVIYNMTLEQLRPIMSKLAMALDEEHRWAGDSLSLPSLGVQLHLDSFPAMKNVSLVASGERQNFAGWRYLELALKYELRSHNVRRNPRGMSLVFVALVLVVGCVLRIASDPTALAEGFRGMMLP